MRALDLPIATLRGRTPRELLLLSIGLGYCVYELASPEPCWPNVLMYSIATAAFALRFFPARALGVGVAIGALAQRLPDLRVDLRELETPHTWVALGVIAILASRDLEARFERAPSRIAWLPNAWAELPVRDMRLLRLCAYSLGALGAGLGYAWGVPFFGAADPFLTLGVLGAITGTIVLLAAGRAPALLLVPLICMPIALALGTQVEAAEALLAGGWAELGYGLWWSPQFVLPGLVLAIVCTALALPYCIRLLRVTARRSVPSGE
jgi:hypothetical protein